MDNYSAMDFITKDDIEALAEVASKGFLGERDTDFAEGLVNAYRARHVLSAKQVYWARRLLRIAAVGDSPTKLEDVSKLTQMLKKASGKLKQVRFTITVNGAEYTFSLAKPNSTNPGYIYVKKFGDYIGKISPNNDFTLSNGGNADRDNILEFSADPAKFAAAHGHTTGSCCFCNYKLTTKESLSVGYGPTCAHNYGLPWGKVEEAQLSFCN
jgi:hypothetical protein